MSSTPTGVEIGWQGRAVETGPSIAGASGSLASPHIVPRPGASPAGAARRQPQGQRQLWARGVTKSYFRGRNEVPVLKNVDLEVFPGEFLSVVGQSGSGKSTLLHLLGTLDRPDAGQLWLGNQRIDNVPARHRDRLRNATFGMIFQFYHLLPELTALGNVLSPLMIGNSTFGYLRRRGEFRRRAQELLELVGLGHRLAHKPRQLSGGEMQRTAIARALVNQPKILLADEPTGNLDHATGLEILEILRTLNDRQNLTIVMVTHDDEIAKQADRCVRLVAGQVEQL